MTGDCMERAGVAVAFMGDGAGVGAGAGAGTAGGAEGVDAGELD